MRRTLERLRSLASSSSDRTTKAREVAGLIRAARDYHWVGLYDVTSTEIAAIAWTGTKAPEFPRFPVTRGLNGAAVAARRPVIVQDVTRDPRYLTTFGATRAGTIDVESDRPNAFTPEDEVFLTGCAEVLVPLWAAVLA